MKLKSTFLAMFLLVSILQGCKISGATPTPLPGWRYPVYQLLVEDSIFPQGWTATFPQDTSVDPTANHVWRTWSHSAGARAEQAIWRGYSITDAQTKYDELQQQFNPSRPMEPNAKYVELKPPTSIDTKNLVADEMYLACGWVYIAYCEVIARYRNFVTDIRMDLDEEFEDAHSEGLSYEQIDKIIRAMDNKFGEFLSMYPLILPTD